MKIGSINQTAGRDIVNADTVTIHNADASVERLARVLDELKAANIPDNDAELLAQSLSRMKATLESPTADRNVLAEEIGILRTFAASFTTLTGVGGGLLSAINELLGSFGLHLPIAGK